MTPSAKLTVAILDEFEEFGGDMLAYVRSGRDPLKFDWDRIDELLSQIFLVRAGLASAAFRSNLNVQLSSVTSDDAVRERLWAMGGDRVVKAGVSVAV